LKNPGVVRASRMDWSRNVPVVLLTILTALFISGSSGAQDAIPSPRGAVNDFAGVMSAGDVARTEALAREVLEKTGAAVVVATFSAIGGHDIQEYANRLYSFWGIGKRGQDRGVLIVLVLQERTIWIETGYGVEGVLPDGRVGEILDQKVLPYLKRGEYSRGLASSVEAISGVLAEEAGVTLTDRPEAGRPVGRAAGQRSGGAGSWFLILFILLLLLLMGTRKGREIDPLLFSGARRRAGGDGDFEGFESFGGGFGGFGGGSSGGGGAGRHF